MTESRSYYELLGVRETATGDEIRAAYVRLMKQYHPDAGTGNRSGAALVPLLNRCYATLRDPAKRAAYDSTLKRPADPVSRIPVRNPQKQSGGAGLSVGAVALIASFLAATLLAIVLDEPTRRARSDIIETASGWVSPPPAPPARKVDVPAPSASERQRMAKLARSLSVGDAERLSRRCFATASRENRPGAADSCVLFDVAFLYWRKPAVNFGFPAHFADQVVANRHQTALLGYGAQANSRLALLRESAFRGLIDEVRGSGTGTAEMADPNGADSGAGGEAQETAPVPQWDKP